MLRYGTEAAGRYILPGCLIDRVPGVRVCVVKDAIMGLCFLMSTSSLGMDCDF